MEEKSKEKKQEESKKEDEKKEEAEKKHKPADEADLDLYKRYIRGPYTDKLKSLEEDISKLTKGVNSLCGVRESETGIALPSLWQTEIDKKAIGEDSLMVGRLTKIIEEEDEENKNLPKKLKYVIHIRQMAKYIVDLDNKLSPTDVEESMRVGVEKKRYRITLPLPPKIDPTVSLMTVEERPDVSYNDIGGYKEQMEQLKEVLETPLLNPQIYTQLGIDPPKGVMLYGPPGTGKTLTAKAVANRTDACFIKISGCELVQKYVGEGARLVREIFQMARTKKACIIFFDEIDSIGGVRSDDPEHGDTEVQRTMLEIVNQLDGFESRGNIKVLMATNRPDVLDPALVRPGRVDRKIEFNLPDLEGRVQIFKIHARSMPIEKDVRFELLARLCNSTTGADIRSVCIEAGMYAIRERRKYITEKDLLDSIEKVIKGYSKFSANKKYMIHN
jgi:26S proteasome regulatory subunit T1